MDSKVVFIDHPYYAVNNPSNNLRIYKKNKNNSDAYEELAKRVINASNYQQIDNLTVWGDEQIDLKSKGENNGNAPSFWISVRANLYMTIQCSRIDSSLVLDL